MQLTLNHDITDTERAEVLAALRRTASLESVSFSTVGEVLGDPTSRVIGYVVGIADVSALERYMYDPVHLAGDDIILPRVSHGSAVRFASEPVGEQVFAVAQAKAVKYPEWGRRVAEIFGE